MSHSCPFWRNACGYKVHYLNQDWREADEVHDGTVGVGDPHNVELVILMGITVGCSMMLLRESYNDAGLEDPFPVQISEAFSFVGSLESTHLPEPRTHNGRRFLQNEEGTMGFILTVMTSPRADAGEFEA